MTTFKKITDRISNTIKSQNKDGRVPQRYILSVFQNKLSFLITQKLRDRSLFREDGLYTVVDCVELCKINTFACDIVEFRSCDIMTKSKYKLPGIINSRFGPAVRSVTSIDNSTEFFPTTPSKYRNSKKRAEEDTNLKYYIKNGYLYLPDSSVERVNMEILTLEPYLIKGCGDGSCKSYWDYDLPTSDKLTEIAVQETLKELGYSKSIQEDQNPNLLEGA